LIRSAVPKVVAFPTTTPSPINANVGQTVRASVTVKNTGQAAATVWVQVTGTGISPSPARAEVNLAGGATATVTIDFTIQPPGNRTITLSWAAGVGDQTHDSGTHANVINVLPEPAKAQIVSITYQVV